MRLFGREFTKDQVHQLIGDINQVVGISCYTLENGEHEGLSGFEVKTGSGFRFTVLPERNMDISWIEKSGYPIGSINNGIITNPKYGSHQRVQNTRTEKISHSRKWDGGTLMLSVEGKVREDNTLSGHISNTRRIITYGGENKLVIYDKVENEGFAECPIMLFYQMNFVYPLVSEQSQIYSPIICTNPGNQAAKNAIESYARFTSPFDSYDEQVYIHGMARDSHGNTCIGIINESLNLGLYVRYNYNQLPILTQHKKMGNSVYGLEMQIGNLFPVDVDAELQKEDFIVLKSGEDFKIQLEVGILNTWEEIQGYKAYVDMVMKKYR